MNWINVGFVTALVGNGLFPLLVSVLGWKLLQHVRSGHEEIMQAAKRLKLDADEVARQSRQAQDTFTGVRAELTQLLEAARSVAGAEPCSPYQEWAARDPQGIHDQIGGQHRLIEEMSQIEPAAFADWRRSNRAELDRVLAQKSRLFSELESLKDRHEEARRQVRDLQLRSQHQSHAIAESQELKVEVNRLRADLDAATKEAHMNEVRVKSLQAKVERMKHAAAAPDTQSSELKSSLSEAEAEKSRLAAELDRIKSSLARTLTEKAFIEDQFLQMDAREATGTKPH